MNVWKLSIEMADLQIDGQDHKAKHRRHLMTVYFREKKVDLSQVDFTWSVVAYTHTSNLLSHVKDKDFYLLTLNISINVTIVNTKKKQKHTVIVKL